MLGGPGIYSPIKGSHFVPTSELAVAEVPRVVRPGGIVAATVWDTFGDMPSQRMFWNTFIAIEPAAFARRGFALVRPMKFPGEMARGIAAAGPRKRHGGNSDYPIGFANFDDYWILAHQRPRHVGGIPFNVASWCSERVQDAVRLAYLSDQQDGPRSFANAA